MPLTGTAGLNADHAALVKALEKQDAKEKRALVRAGRFQFYPEVADAEGADGKVEKEAAGEASSSGARVADDDHSVHTVLSDPYAPCWDGYDRPLPELEEGSFARPVDLISTTDTAPPSEASYESDEDSH